MYGHTVVPRDPTTSSAVLHSAKNYSEYPFLITCPMVCFSRLAHTILLLPLRARPAVVGYKDKAMTQLSGKKRTHLGSNGQNLDSLPLKTLLPALQSRIYQPKRRVQGPVMNVFLRDDLVPNGSGNLMRR
ncbi:hypothetical protein BaRGS_00019178 [Batillaria attramentaria]|uniref:Uncharacterized protein n=1 Tax=Batillaria attramentaria TaxID=370345 RepID=A0ABD0KQV0_9CAEN